ncbi:hypothetical protein [Erythrobacter tepidarius]|uniref:rhamnosyltransferase WsaF family glycosyltransferase n=1 Tax=Erythrobacter tepidarius TaxID=60454 RepID=UPI000A388EA1|nr:hypothetical protein [Erythrobacter tepidarius]
MNARNFLKQNLPPQVKGLVHRLRARIAAPPIDEAVLAEFAIAPDPDPTPRLTMVIPLLQKGADFGGTATGIDIFARLCLALMARGALDVRVIITDVIAETDPSIVTNRCAKAGLALTAGQIERVKSPRATIAVRRHEIFMTYNWWTTLNFAALRDAQAKAFGRPPRPMIWLMQDYEPAFMEFSSGHMLARAAYDTSAPLWGVINSSNLAEYLAAVGHAFDRSFVFEPVISDALRPYLNRVPTSQRKQRVLVYGRPHVARNCFPALVRGLRRWARDYPEFGNWEVVSAGTAHDPVALGDGRQLRSVGKLSLDDYAQMLLESSAGVSLMASPHPSYPPLEMAHFGVRTVTNGYVCKDLSRFHPNITSLTSIAEVPLAAALAEACRKAATPAPVFGNAEYLRETAYPFMDDLCAATASALVEG